MDENETIGMGSCVSGLGGGHVCKSDIQKDKAVAVKVGLCVVHLLLPLQIVITLNRIGLPTQGI